MIGIPHFQHEYYEFGHQEAKWISAPEEGKKLTKHE